MLYCNLLLHYISSTLNNNKSGMTVESYGTGTQVRLPGKSAMEPRIFKFGTPYADMYNSMTATPEDVTFFTHNGVLQLCKRGSSVKVCMMCLVFMVVLRFSGLGSMIFTIVYIRCALFVCSILISWK